MHRHFTYLMGLFPGEVGQSAEKLVTGVLVGLALIILGILATRRISSSEKLESEVIPSRRFSLFGFFDVFLEGFTAFHDSLLGKEGRKYIPFTASIFLFIFFSNIIGLVPGIAAVTTTVWVNVSIALIVFFYFNFHGIKTHGVVGYLKHFFGGPDLVKFPMIFIGLAVCVLEMISMTLRVLTLNLRLFWNITADHTVLASMTNLTSIDLGSFDVSLVVPVAFYLMGTLVSFMQAFVFTILTMIYILLATKHEEGH